MKTYRYARVGDVIPAADVHQLPVGSRFERPEPYPATPGYRRTETGFITSLGLEYEIDVVEHMSVPEYQIYSFPPCPKCGAVGSEPCTTGGYLPTGDLPGDLYLGKNNEAGSHRQRIVELKLEPAVAPVVETALDRWGEPGMMHDGVRKIWDWNPFETRVVQNNRSGPPLLKDKLEAITDLMRMGTAQSMARAAEIAQDLAGAVRLPNTCWAVFSIYGYREDGTRFAEGSQRAVWSAHESEDDARVWCEEMRAAQAQRRHNYYVTMYAQMDGVPAYKLKRAGVPREQVREQLRWAGR